MFGLPQLPLGMLGVAGGTDTRPTNTPEDMTALQKLYAAAHLANQTPNGHVARGFSMFGPQESAPGTAMLPTPPTPAPVNMGALSAAAQAPTPPAAATHAVTMPTPSAPAGAPTPADMGQAANIPIGPNYNMPAFGTASDQGSDPSVIAKLLSFFKNKDNPSA